MAFRIPLIHQKSSTPDGGIDTGAIALDLGDCTVRLQSTFLRNASFNRRILPRPKKVSPGHFFAPALPVPAFRIPLTHQKSSTPDGVELFWRRVRDSNPRFLSESPVFKTGSLNRSDNSPCELNYIISQRKCQAESLSSGGAGGIR